jgi:hypothetical protein
MQPQQSLTEQQTLAVASIFERAEETAKQHDLGPEHTAVALAIAAGAYAAGAQQALEETLDVVAKAYNGARKGTEQAAASRSPGEAAERGAEPPKNARKKK